jgi:hypothetical protein
MYGPGDVRVEDRPDPQITAPTEAIIRLSATCVCGSDLWSWRGSDPVTGPVRESKHQASMGSIFNRPARRQPRPADPRSRLRSEASRTRAYGSVAFIARSSKS